MAVPLEIMAALIGGAFTLIAVVLAHYLSSKNKKAIRSENNRYVRLANKNEEAKSSHYIERDVPEKGKVRKRILMSFFGLICSLLLIAFFREYSEKSRIQDTFKAWKNAHEVEELVVKDSWAGSMWTREDAEISVKSKYTDVLGYEFEDAIRYCDELQLLGFTDWTLPGKIDLGQLSNIYLFREYNRKKTYLIKKADFPDHPGKLMAELNGIKLDSLRIWSSNNPTINRINIEDNVSVINYQKTKSQQENIYHFDTVSKHNNSIGTLCIRKYKRPGHLDRDRQD